MSVTGRNLGRSDYFYVVCVALVTLYGAFLRFHHLADQSFWMDEAFSTLHAKAILEHGYPLLSNGLRAWGCFVVHYIMALGLSLFSDIHFGARFFSAAAGAVIIPVFYYFNLQMFRSRLQALTACLLLAFMSYEIAWCRQARMYVFLQLFSISAMIFWIKFIDRRRFVFLALAGLFFVLSVLTHRAGYGLAVFFLVAALCEARNFGEWIQWATAHRAGIAGCVASAVLVLAGLLMLSTNESLIRTLQGVRDVEDINYTGMYLSFLKELFGFLLLWAATGVVISCVARTRRAVPLLLIMAVYLYVISARTMLFHLRYLLVILPFIMSFAACGLAGVVEMVARLPKKPVRLAGRVAVIILFILSVPLAAFTFVPYGKYYLGWTAPQPDWEKACAWIERDHTRHTGGSQPLPVISTFPEFADLYLSGPFVRKHFLPFSLTGYPGDYQAEPLYTSAQVVTDPRQIASIRGYVMLDRFGLERITDKELAAYLKQLGPTYVVPGRFKVFVWKVTSK